MESHEVGSINLKKLSTKILGLKSQKQEKGVRGKEDNRKYKRKQRPLTQQQIQVFRQAFDIFDENKSGSIDEEELGSLLLALGFHYNEMEIKRILNEVDKDGSGVIEVEEFIDFMSRQIVRYALCS